MPCTHQDSILTLAIEIDTTHLTASAFNARSGDLVYNHKVELDADTLVDDRCMLTKKESGLAIRSIAKGLDRIFESMHESSISIFRTINAIVVAAGVELVLELDSEVCSRLSLLDPQCRLEEQMPAVYHWPHYDPSSPSHLGNDAMKATKKSLVSIATLLESFILGRMPRSHIETTAGTTCTSKTRQYIGNWLINRFGANLNCVLFDSLSSHVAAYLSFMPQGQEGGLSFGNTDCMIIPLDHPPLSTSYQCLPNPLYLLEKCPYHKPWLLIIKSIDAGLVREIVRDTYTKSWSAFDQLLYAVCPGGSVGLDSKLFSFYVRKGPMKGIHRFENGTQTSEFGDLRANARCIIEGQALALRCQLSQLRDNDNQKSTKEYSYTGAGRCIGFNPRDETLMLPCWYAWGQDSVTNGVLDTFTQILGAPIYKVKEGSTEGDMRQLPLRILMGAAYYGIYSLHLQDQPDSRISFREYIHSLNHSACATATDPQRIRTLQEPFLPCLEEGDSDSEQGTITEVYVARPRPRRRFFSASEDEQKKKMQQRSRSRSSTVVSISASDDYQSSYSDSSSYATQMTSSPKDISCSSQRKHIAIDSIEYSSSVSCLSETREYHTQAEERQILEAVSEPDEDLWEFYAALLEEHIRLSSMIEHKTRSKGIDHLYRAF